MQRYELRLLLPCHMMPRKEAADMLASLQCSATEQQGLAPQLVEQLPAQPAALAAAAGGQATCSTDKVTSADHPTARATTRRLKSTRQDLLLPLSCAEGGISQPPFPPIRLAVRHSAARPPVWCVKPPRAINAPQQPSRPAAQAFVSQHGAAGQ